MATWLNHVAIAAPRNGTTSHTVDPNGGTVAAGSNFSPTAGRLLVCFAEGAVTSTTPSGWTLPTNGSAINNTGLYVCHRTAAGGDTITTTHNASNYPVVFDFYEFNAGSTFTGSASSTGVSPSGGAGPTLSGLSGTHWDAGIMGQIFTSTGAVSMTWNAGVEAVDTKVDASGTDGYLYGLTYTEDATGSSASYAATSTNTVDTVERLVVSVVVAATYGSGRRRHVVQHLYNYV